MLSATFSFVATVAGVVFKIIGAPDAAVMATFAFAGSLGALAAHEKYFHGQDGGS